MTKGATNYIPSFLTKLYQILENKDYHHIIHWSNNGSSFTIETVIDFSNQILPVYYKHSNFTSFVRQLNMYSFKTFSNEESRRTFNHIHFIKGKKNIFHLIKRQKIRRYQDKPIEQEQIQNEGKNDKKIKEIVKAQDLLENKWNILINIRNDLLKEKNERIIYDKHLQVALLGLIQMMIDNYSMKKANNNIFPYSKDTRGTYLFDCLKLLDKKLIDETIDLISITASQQEIGGMKNNEINPNHNLSNEALYNHYDIHPSHHYNLSDDYFSLSNCVNNSIKSASYSSIQLSILSQNDAISNSMNQE